jgi:hypothetical protein
VSFDFIGYLSKEVNITDMIMFAFSKIEYNEDEETLNFYGLKDELLFQMRHD